MYCSAYEGIENASLLLLKWLLMVSMVLQTDILVCEVMSGLEFLMRLLAAGALISVNILCFLFVVFEVWLFVVSLGYYMF